MLEGGRAGEQEGWRLRAEWGHLLSLQGRCPAPTSVAVSGQPKEACEEGRGAAGQTGHGGHRVPAAESRKPCKSHSPVHAGPRRPGQRNREAMRLPHTSLLRSRRGHAVTTPVGPSGADPCRGTNTSVGRPGEESRPGHEGTMDLIPQPGPVGDPRAGRRSSVLTLRSCRRGWTTAINPDRGLLDKH